MRFKTTKRTLAWALALCIVFPLLPAMSVPALAAGERTGSFAPPSHDNAGIDIGGRPETDADAPNREPKAMPMAIAAFSSGSGTAQDPYIITTPEELNDVRNGVNAHYRLGNDIDLAVEYPVWVPVYDSFSGTLDGAGFSIKNLNINRPDTDWNGLFEHVTQNGVIKNLTIESGTITGKSYTGGIVGQNNGRVENCYNYATVTGAGRTGGIVGSNIAGGIVTNCHNTSSVTGTERVGGVAGGNWGTVTDCDNTGSVNGTGNFCIGGVAGVNGNTGVIISSDNTGNVTGKAWTGGVAGENYNSITNCTNEGIITGALNSIGGIAGYNEKTLTDCENSGAVSGSSSVGGIAGNNGEDVTRGTIQNCNNSADITGTGGQAGGIAGTNSGTIENSENKAASIITGNATYTGGIAGNNYGSGVIQACENEGAVNGKAYTGGIVGSNANTGTITGCENNGEVSSSGNMVGGVVGYNVATGTVTYCDNNAAVTGNSVVGGIMGQNLGNVSDCDNDGAVEGTDKVNGKVGGIIGENGGSGVTASTVTNCNNSSDVTGGALTGGVVGYNWAGINTCTNTAIIEGTDKVGGIAGESKGGTIVDCDNTGAVTGVSNMGGIAGRNITTGTISGCDNTGTVTGSGNIIGGVVGFNENGSTLTNCDNNARVTGMDYTGGVSGQNSGTINSSENTGRVKGNNKVGGITGENNGGTITSCLNEGAVIGTNNVGGIAGVENGGSITSSDNEGSVNGVGVVTPWSGDGTLSSPYLISDEDGLIALADAVNNGNSCQNEYFKLTSNITLTSADWEPIGSFTSGAQPTSTPFEGRFDGDGYVISNLTISVTHGSSSGIAGVGLFGNIGFNGSVVNLGVEAVSVSSNALSGATGVLAGRCSGKITNCFATGSVSGSTYAGGLVGESMVGSVIRNSYATAVVSAAVNSGGLVGFTRGGPIVNCYATGNVTATGNSGNAGGLVGLAAGDSSFTNCFAAGVPSGSDANKKLGGLVGANADFGSNNFTTTITSCYWNNATAAASGLPNTNFDASGTTTDPRTSTTDITGSSAMAIGDMQTQAFADTLTTNSPDNTVAWTWAGSGYPQLFIGLPGYSGGDGTSGAPYQISDENDLKEIRDTVNNGYSYSGVYFELTTNIILSAGNWTPIGIYDGSSENPFVGTFDGGGHIISNLTVNTPYKDAGLFGIVKNGTIKNLNVEASSVSSSYNYVHNSTPPVSVGILAGQNNGGTIENCSAVGTASGMTYTGGLVGWNRNGDIINCYANVTTSGQRIVGGLVGFSDCASVNGNTITGCFAAGAVSAHIITGPVGGLVGFNGGSFIANCYATGSVTGMQDQNDDANDVGGLVGRQVAAGITNSYAAGAVSGGAQTGGLVGYMESANITNGYFDEEVTGQTEGVGDQNAAASGTVTALSTVLMVTPNVLTSNEGKMSGLGTAFAKRANNASYCYYPELAGFYGGTQPQQDASEESVRVSLPYGITLTPSGDKTFTDATMGYGAQTAYSVTVYNAGSNATGAITITLSGTNADSFTLSKSSISNIILNGSDSFTVVPKTGLSVGSYTATVTVSDSNGTTLSFVISFSVKSGGGNGGNSGNGGGSGNSSNGDSGGSSPSTSKNVPVIVDGVTHNIGTSITTGNTTTVTVDNAELYKQIQSASDHVIIPISNISKTNVAQLVVKHLDDMTERNMTLVVQSGDVSYNIPASAVDTKALMDMFHTNDPSEVPVSIAITHLDENAITVTGGTLMLPPVAFTVTATHEGKSVNVTVFTQYVSRVIEIPSGVDASKITTAIVKESDGTERHVPTRVYQQGGKWFAEINSLTNSTYALIYNEQTFTDSKGKWYESTVGEMASRKIISGIGNNLFAGERDITRAEFAAIIVRALGLPSNGDGSVFIDVPRSAWYCGAVGTAHEYGLVAGVGNDKFDPLRAITRQEAMLMIQRAAKITGLTGSMGSIETFPDAEQVSNWALDAARWNVGSGLVVGANGKLNPLNNITRAETATLVLKLLQKARLVDVRTKI